MEDNTAIPSSPVEAACSTANVNPVSPESLNFPVNPNPIDVYPANADHVEEVTTGAGERMSLSTLKALLQRQLEYYFSRENLSTDEYLQSQMDADNYVAISTVANFNQVRRLTDDLNLVVEVLRESAVVQVDEAGEKVRPNPRSGVLILREIPEETPLEEIEELFSGENCPKFLKAEFAHNDSWYVLFESDEDTQKAYQYLREEAKTFRGKPVMARIKAKAITSAPFTTCYKNGFTTPQEPENYNGQNVNQQQQQPLQYAYSVPNENYNNQQVCSPFYPPTMLQTWAPTTPACVDLGTVFSVNGLTPTQAFRPLSGGNSNRHNYARDRPVKAYTPQNYNFSRSEQNRYFNRGQSASYLGRQQLHQQAATFPNIVNASNCATFDYLPYATRSRNLNFGMDMNFFTAPNLYYSKLPSVYPAHASQSRQNPVLMQRNQLGVSAINCQDQGYLAVGNSNSLPYSKDSGMNGASGGKQSGDSQVKENWVPNQRQQRGKRHWKDNNSSGSSRNYSDSSNNAYNKSLGETEVKSESPKFDLETTSFPPLPGCLETDIVDVDVYESRLSDIVKGTVKPATRDTKTQTSESGIVCTTKDSSTITLEDTVISSDGAFTPPDSPDVVVETGSANEPAMNENCQESNEWNDFIDSSTENAVGSSSINSINTVPEAPSTFNGNSTPVFHLVSTNSLVNGSAAIAESSTPNLPEAEPLANVPSEINDKQTATIKLPKSKQLDSIPKNSRPQCDLPSPKNKTPDVSTKNKFDSFKDRASGATKQNRTSFSSNNKNCESSSSNNKNEKVNDCLQTITRPTEHNVSRNSDVSHNKDKGAQGHKNKVLDSNSNKANKTVEPEPTLLAVNGHATAADSESTVSSEDEKPFRRLTYCEVASRGKDKLEKVAQEVKLKDQQEATIRQHHRQQENVAQSRQASTRGPFREIPRGRTVEARPGAKEYRGGERRKSSRPAVPLPAAGR